MIYIKSCCFLDIVMKGFKDWLMLEFQRGRAKLGLYPPMDSVLGQYPPLYVTPRSADFITYYDIEYKGKGAPGKSGFIWYSDIRSSDKTQNNQKKQ